MRILHINISCGSGSTGRLALELANHSVESGHEVLFAYSTGSAPFANSYKIGNFIDHKAHAFLSRLTGRQGYFSLSATRKLLKKLDQFAPDVVHLHNLHSNYIHLPLLLKYVAKKNIATVITLHDSWFYTGKCTSYVPASCEKWQSSCGDCPLLHIDNVNPTFWFDRTKDCHADKKRLFTAIPRLGVIGVSDWISNEAKQSFLNAKEITTIYNWVDTEVFTYRESAFKAQYGIEDKKVVLMVTSSISEKKGYRELLYLAEHLPDDYAVVCVGKNINNLFIPKRVIHVEHTDNAKQLAEIYSAADVCVNTTQYETFGLVTVEAMACGTPAIVYNNTASPELVKDQCGLVLDQEAGYGNLLSKVIELCNDPLLKRDERIIRIRERFEKKKVIDRYSKFLQEISTK